MLDPNTVRFILDKAPVDLFYSAEDSGLLDWPWRMMGAYRARDIHFEDAEYGILDSSFQHEEVDIRRIIEIAEKTNPDCISMVDIHGDIRATVEQIKQDIPIIKESDFNGDILIPLQPPHDRCYRELKGLGDIYGIGGVAKEPDSVKIESTRKLREEASEDIRIHGLGFGATDTMIREIRRNPELLDSIDSRSAYDKAMTRHIDETWKASNPTQRSGRNIVISAFAVAYLLERLRRMIPNLSQDPADRSSTASEVDW